MDNVSDYMESHFIIHYSQAYEYDASEWYVKVYVVVSIMMTTMKLYYLYQSMIWQYTWGSVSQHLDILFGQVSKY
jgi:hypothetical protein